MFLKIYCPSNVNIQGKCTKTWDETKIRGIKVLSIWRKNTGITIVVILGIKKPEPIAISIIPNKGTNISSGIIGNVAVIKLAAGFPGKNFTIPNQIYTKAMATLIHRSLLDTTKFSNCLSLRITVT